MTRDAQAHAEEDKKKKEFVEARNRLDSMIYTTEKSLKDYGDKLSDGDRKKLDEVLSQAKGALGKDDTAEIKKAEEELTAASHKIAEEMYKHASAKSGPAADGKSQSGQSGPGTEDVTDAEYKVEDDK